MPGTATSYSPWGPWDGPRATTRAAVTRVHLGCDTAEEWHWCRELSGHRPAGPTNTLSEEACAVPSNAKGQSSAPCSVQCVAGLLTQRPVTGWLVPAVCEEAASCLLGAMRPHHPVPACSALTGVYARWHHGPRCSGASHNVGNSCKVPREPSPWGLPEGPKQAAAGTRPHCLNFQYNTHFHVSQEAVGFPWDGTFPTGLASGPPGPLGSLPRPEGLEVRTAWPVQAPSLLTASIWLVAGGFAEDVKARVENFLGIPSLEITGFTR